MLSALADPLQVRRLQAALIRLQSGLRNQPEAMPRSALRPRMGVIQQAVLEVLDRASVPLRPCEVRLRVELRLAQPVSYDTAASYLSVACRDQRGPIVRVSSGRYGLRR